VSRRGGDGLSRRQRVKQAKAKLVASPSGEVKVSILTGVTNTSEGLDLSHDVRLVRSALLYADKVELVSPVAAMLAGILTGLSQGGDFVAEMMTGLDDSTLRYLSDGQDPGQLRAQLQLMRSLSSLPRAQRRKLLTKDQARQLAEMTQQFRQVMNQGAEGMGTAMQGMWERAGAPDLEPAAAEGLLTIRGDVYDFTLPNDRVVDHFADGLQRLVEDPTNHLMFDRQMGDLTRKLLEARPDLEQRLAPHTKRATLGAGLTTRLPAFPDASMTAIIDARTELSAPLSRYRRAVGDMSERLAAGPVDNPELATEIEDLWRDDVQPALQSLASDLSATALAQNLVGQLPTDGRAWGGLAALGVSYMQVGVGALTELTQPAALVAGASLAGTALGDAVKATVSKRKDARSHDLYYLLALNDHLA